MHAGWIYERHYTLPNNTGTTPEVNATSMPHPHESDVVQQDTIRFKIHFSSQPQLQVTYLVSYEGVGSVELTLHKSTQHVFDNTTAVMRHVLNAAQKEPFSIPKTAVFVHPTAPPGQKKSSLLLPGSISEGEYIMAFRPLPGDREKFKLLGIASC